jgi:uncharacterized Zn finger protein (UPF0148 family)
MAHCPRCGHTMALHPDGRLRCVAGEMVMSRQLTDETRLYIEGEQLETVPIAFPAGGAWHCPADGELLDEKDGRLYCSRCARFLPARIWYQVVEYHLHR